MIEAMTSTCGHERALHDPFGCAAFLGAFPETAELEHDCRCTLPGGVGLTPRGAALRRAKSGLIWPTL